MDTYGLVGYPLGHSFSAAFFAEKFRRENIAAEYLNFEIPDMGELATLLAQHPSLRGFNVTIPHKQHIMPHLASLSREAAEIGAVNVVRVVREAGSVRLEGHNTDVIGFTESLRPLLRPGQDRALVLGTGGASRAVVYGLRLLGIIPQLVSRRAQSGCMTYEELSPEVMASHRVVVNCTPVGMYPHIDECPPIPYDEITSRHLLYDLVYNPERTAYLAKGEERGAQTKNGLEMLHLQALAAWDIWQGAAR